MSACWFLSSKRGQDIPGDNYSIMIDAGSSGSRLMVYSWKSDPSLHSLPSILTRPEWQIKKEPGLSFFDKDTSGLPLYLKTLLDHAKDIIPKKSHSQTFIYLFATAGMRLIPIKSQSRILKTSCDFVRANYDFVLRDCSKQFQVISGESEGIYGWLTLNYLKKTLVSSVNSSNTVGFMDLGGASAQVAFETSRDMKKKHLNDLKTIQLRFLDGSHLSIQIFVATFLGFGTNEARKRYLEQTISIVKDYNSTLMVIQDPCLPLGLERKEWHHNVSGIGNMEECLRRQIALLNEDLPCPDTPCYFNGVHIPIQSFSSQKFSGISEFWYSLQDVFGLGGEYDTWKHYNATRQFCSKPWSMIQEEYRNGSFPFTRDVSRLESQCFKASWVWTLLHQGFRFPMNESLRFDTLESIDSVSISWTLGALLEQISLHATHGYGTTLFLITCIAVCTAFGMYLFNLIKSKYRKARKLSYPIHEYHELDHDTLTV